jgi:hypothetical protein
VLNGASRDGTIRPMTGEITIPATLVPQSCSRPIGKPIDHAIAELAKGQHGVVALWQLVALGLSARAVRARVAAGRLHRIHRGVYAVGHALLSARGRWTAAVLACGRGAVLSHRSAAALQDLRPSASTSIEVVVPRRRSSSPTGIVVRCRSGLADADMTVAHDIPCTSFARTALDLAAVLDDVGVEKVCDRAEQLRLFDLRAIEDVLTRNPGARGAGRLRRVLTRLHPQGPRTRLELERRFLRLCRLARLPIPLVNEWVQLDGPGFLGDFVWPRERLIVETDGSETHLTRRAFEDDRRRDQLLAVAGYRTLRFTWRQVTAEPERVARTVGAVLAERSVTPTLP